MYAQTHFLLYIIKCSTYFTEHAQLDNMTYTFSSNILTVLYVWPWLNDYNFTIASSFLICVFSLQLIRSIQDGYTCESVHLLYPFWTLLNSLLMERLRKKLRWMGDGP